MFGPIFSFEMSRLARRRSHYVSRFVHGTIVVLLIYYLHESFVGQRLRVLRRSPLEVHSLVGITSLMFFTLCQFLGVLAITPAVTAGAITEDQERKTFHFLLASPLTGAEIILGKLASRLTAVVLHVALGLPILSILTLAGGIDPRLVMLVFAGTISTAFAVGAGSILVSVLSRRGAEATISAYVLMLLWLILPPLVDSSLAPSGGTWRAFYVAWIRPANDLLIASNPLAILFSMLRGWSPKTLEDACARMIVIQLAFGTATTIAAIPLPRVMFRLREDRRGWPERLGFKSRRTESPPIGDDPMLWKEFHAIGENSRSNLRAAIVGGLLAAVALYQSRDSVIHASREFYEHGYSVQNASGRQELNIAIRVWTCGVYFAWIVFVNVAAAGGIARERESDTWESLLSTELSAGEIVKAKLIGPAWRLRFLLVMILSLTTFGVLLGAVHPLGWLAQACVIVVATWYASALGTYCSLRAKSSRKSLATSVGILMFQNVGYLLILVLFGMDNFFMPLASSPWIVAASPISHRDLAELIRIPTGSDSFAWRYGGRIAFSCFLGTFLHIIFAYKLTRLSARAIRRELSPTEEPRSVASPPAASGGLRQQAASEAALG